MFVNMVRVMDVDDCKWRETIPDTCYRNNQDWLICRSRGSHHGGRITGHRFYVITRTTSGSPMKLRSAKGQVRYFATPLAAAHAAFLYSQHQVLEWSKTKLQSEIEELTSRLTALRKEIEETEAKRVARRTLFSKSKSIEKHEETKMDVLSTPAKDDDDIANVHPMFQRVTHVLKQIYKH